MTITADAFDWPSFALRNDIPRQLRQWRGRLGRFALATLVSRTGSSPQPVGCQMLVGDDYLAGYVSGGCVESNLAYMAQEIIETGKGAFIAFGADSPFLDVQLPCGTRIELAVEAFEEEEPVITTLIENGERRAPVLLASDIDLKERLCVPLNGAVPEAEGESGHLLRTIFQGRDVATLPEAGRIGQVYWKRFTPTPRLIVNGGDPVAIALSLMAEVAGFDVILNRSHGPAEGFARESITYRRLSPEALFQALPLDPWTAVVTTTHNLDADHGVLLKALPSEAFYVGVLGSRHHLAQRRVRLLEEGISEAELARLHAPIGLNIGAVGPNEIAVAIVSDLVRAWRQA